MIKRGENQKYCSISNYQLPLYKERVSRLIAALRGNPKKLRKVRTVQSIMLPNG